MKILILILSYDAEYVAYNRVNGIDATWRGAINDPDIQSYYYYGGASSRYHNKDEIHLTTINTLPTLGILTLECLGYVLANFEFDYILRTNISSYFHIENLKNWLRDKPLKSFYAGVVGDHSGIKFASGAGILLSRDSVEYLVSSKQRLNLRLMDDIAISEMLKGYTLTPAPRIDFSSSSDFDPNFDRFNFHFRCKNLYGDRTDDCVTMGKIHDSFNKV
jgi:hypothetical protein